jgi:hypothetical protein
MEVLAERLILAPLVLVEIMEEAVDRGLMQLRQELEVLFVLYGQEILVCSQELV